MKTALGHYAQALRQASNGGSGRLEFVSADGDPMLAMDAGNWVAGLQPGDVSMLDGCTGSTLDVGCGPGRLVAALTRRGVPALGIDVSVEAIRQAREQGAAVFCQDVFADLPAMWRHILLADGNIGIGGDPARLLRRCAGLIASNGTVIVEVGAPGTGTWQEQVRLRHEGSHSGVFWWAAVSADDIVTTAEAADLRVSRMWTEAQRWFATLARAR